MDNQDKATARPWAATNGVVFAKEIMPRHGMFAEQPAVAVCFHKKFRDAAFITSDHYEAEDAEAMAQANAELIATAVNAYSAFEAMRDALSVVAAKGCQTIHGSYPVGTTCLDIEKFARTSQAPFIFASAFRDEILRGEHRCNACTARAALALVEGGEGK